MQVVKMKVGVNWQYETKLIIGLGVDDEQLDCGMLLQVADVFLFKSGREPSGGSRAGEFCEGTLLAEGERSAGVASNVLTKIPKRHDAQFQS
jgi:hypothetical protein